MFVRLGRVLGTTAEHPFWVDGQGWVAAGELQVGDVLVSHTGELLKVEGLRDTDEVQTVYNLEVEEDHTYFVGCDEWGFSVWAHNLCKYNATYDSLNPTRLKTVTATITKNSLNNGTGTTQKTRVNAQQLGKQTDDAGHAIARRLGGPGHKKDNIFPQLKGINRGQYRSFEKEIAKNVKKHGPADVSVEFLYDPMNPKSTRPIQVEYTAVYGNGQVVTKVFGN